MQTPAESPAGAGGGISAETLGTAMDHIAMARAIWDETTGPSLIAVPASTSSIDMASSTDKQAIAKQENLKLA
jgi:hypothetical protein